MSTFAARLRDVEAWVFDLDNTLYPASSTLYDTIGERMTAYIARAAGVDAAEALRLREHYFHEYGATVVGLAKHHGIEASDFLAHVHDVDHGDALAPDPELNALIARLPGRRIVFTNGGGGHGERVLDALRLTPLFEHLFDIEAAALTPKPQMGAYDALVRKTGVVPKRSVFIEDTLRNLEPAHTLGFATVLVGAVHPGGAVPWRSDRDLRRATAHIDDGDHVGQVTRHARDRPVVGESTLVLGAEDANTEPGRLCERRRQRRPGSCLPAGSRDDQRSALCSQLGGGLREAPAGRGGRGDLLRAERSRALDPKLRHHRHFSW